ncbi:ATP-binding protein [Planomonospora corallina]|uniref:ATP-binding protein n=1 Tax=Planomonospora corallina TaxID=1806052 RepID=A0ABV8I288_9ACTN
MGLIEREEERIVLGDLLRDSLSGRGRVALVTGTVATGKSVLLGSFAEEAAVLGALPITAMGSRLERDLPLGVLGQLVRDAPLTPEERTRALALLDEGVRSIVTAEWRSDSSPQIDAQLVHALCTVLLELSERHPLAIVVDDVHHADRASLLCLAYLARRVRFARTVVVLAESDQGRYTDTYFHTEVRQPHWRRIHLAPLSPAGVRSLAAERVGDGTAAAYADAWHAFSGGNPLLVHALISDHVAASSAGREQDPADIAVGEEYGRAVLSCLGDCDPQTLRVVRALAVLDEPASLARMLDMSSEQVRQELQVLNTASLLRDGRFRHEVARVAVLDEMDDEERGELHRWAAEVSYSTGAPPGTVAEHLLGADRIDFPWAVSCLEDAAMAALRSGAVESAVRYLRKAWRECEDENQRTKITTMLVRAEWRINPGASTTHFAELTDAMSRGSLRGSDAVVLAQALLWHGRTESARQVLEQLGRSADPAALPELIALQLWLRVTCPPFMEHIRPTAEQQALGAVTSVAASRRLESSLALAEVLTIPTEQRSVRGIERILESTRMNDVSMDTVENALLALTYAGRADSAVPWCERFGSEAASRNAPSRQARLNAIRAQISIRQGDMVGVERHAREALKIIPLSGWGIAVGGPVSALILALTARGMLAEAHDWLDEPVPDAMFDSRYGLHYLQARGRYHLATGYPGMALRDFQLCGELMVKWDVDAPELIPWRVDAAEACLGLGQIEEARELAQVQLGRCSTLALRARGLATRVLARTSEPQERIKLLRQAVDLLQGAGDRYELARTMCDLAVGYQLVGEYRRSGIMTGRAISVARECGATPLVEALSDRGRHSGAVVSAGDRSRTLSAAERRVATLAAMGYTNAEIAAKLCIAVSTVEQHLTRTYRKLEIGRREELPTDLEIKV